MVYEKLTAEIRKTFAQPEDIHAGQQLTSCRYLRACIDETMRITPPAATDPEREVLDGGLTIDGHYFGRGINVGVSIYALHHNEDTYRDPQVFKPERWIVDEKNGITAQSVAAAESAFSPFSLGPRACPGKHLAYLEMTITVAKVLYRADVRAVEGSDIGAGSPDLIWGRRNKGQYQTQEWFVASKDGPLVQFKARSK